MAENKRNIRVTLGYDVDQRSLQNVVQSTNVVERELRGVSDAAAKSLGQLGPITRTSVEGVRSSFGRMRRDIQYAENDIENLRRELLALGDTRVAPQVEVTGGGTGGALTRFGTSLRNLPSMQIPGAGGLATDAVGNILRLTGAATEAAGGLGALLTVVGPLGIAAGGLAIIMGEAARQGEEAQKRIQAFSQSLGDVAVRVAGGATTSQLQQELAQRQRDQATLQSQIDRLSELRDRANALASSVQLSSSGIPLNTPEFAALQAVNAEIRAITGEQAQSFGQLGAVIETLQEKFTGITPEIAAINVLLGSSEVALNDAREAEQRLAEARTAAVLRNADDAQRLAQIQAQYASFSSAQAETELKRLRTQTQGLIAARREIQNSGDTSEAATTRIAEYGRQIRENQYFIQRLMNEYLPLIEAREREEAAIKAQISAIDQQIALETQAYNLLGSGTVQAVDQRLDAINAEQIALSRQIPALQALAATSEDGAKRLEQAQQRMGALNAELATLNAIRPEVAARQYRDELQKLDDALTKDVARIEAARDQRIVQIREGLADKEAEAEIARLDAANEARRDANIAREKQEEEHQRNLRRIVARANATIAVAIGARDALAAYLAQQQKEEELKQEKEANKERLREIDAREKEALRTIQKRYDDQLHTARAAADKAIRLERDKATAEINTRQAAYTAELQQLQSALFAQYSLQQQFWNASIALASRAVQQISQQQVAAPVIPNYYQIPQTGNAYADFAAYQRSQGIPGFAYGGNALGLARVNDGTGSNAGIESGLTRSGKLMYFSEPTRVFSASDTRRMLGGNTSVINLNFDGRAIRATSRAQALDVLDGILREAGIA